MAWPLDPLDVEVGLYLDGQWVNAVDTSANGNGVRLRDEIMIRHGRSDWASVADPSQASFTLDNRDGRWSPDNPDGPYYGLFRRNVPCRIGIGRGEIHLRPTTVSLDLASTPDHASLDVAGDLDVRIEFEVEQDLVDIGQGGDPARLAWKVAGTAGWGWSLFYLDGAVRSQFSWYDSGGTLRSYDTADSGAALPLDFQHEHRALRAVLDVSAGELTWYTSTTLAGSWTQLGAVCSGVGATSIGASTAALAVGGRVGDDRIAFPGRIYDFELYDGATRVAAAAFNEQTAGDTSWTDAEGRTWSIGDGGELSGMLWRFHGELSAIPTRWNIDGSDVWAPVEATGLFRRLRQGNRRLESSLRRGLLAQANSVFGADVVAYWPMEETGRELTVFGAAVGGGPLVITGDTPSTGAYSGFACSDNLPTLGDSVLTASVDTYSPSTEWQVRWLQHIPSTATSGGAWFDIIRITTTVLTWVVQWQDTASGNMRVLAYNSGGSLVYTGGTIAMAATGKAFRVSLAIYPNGSNIDLDFQAQVAGGVPGGVIVSNAITTTTPGRVTQIKVNEDANLDDWAIGHITVQNAVTPTTELADELNAFRGERAADRVRRLCAEEGIATRIEGDPVASQAMGPQRPGTLMKLLEECARTDIGVLFESRETVAVAFRCRTTMVTQPVIIDMDYAGGDVARSIDLDRDDQEFANDITIENQSGATARAVLDDGSVMSISEPPVGAGRYQTSVATNLYNDENLPDLAAGHLTLSTVDEPRISALTIGLQHAAPAADVAFMSAVMDATLGDLVRVQNPLESALGASADPIRQLLQGYRERISSFEHELVLTTTPASPWDTDPVPTSGGGGGGGGAGLAYAWESRPAYVEPNPDAAGGTAEKTLATALGITNRVSVANQTQLNSAISGAAPGDQIYVTATITGSGSNRVVDWAAGNPSGTETNPIMITCAPGVWLDGGQTAEDLNSRGLYIVGNDHIWLYGANVRNANFLCMFNQCNGSAANPARVWYCNFLNAGHSMLNIAGNFGSGGESSYFDVRYNLFDNSGVYNQEFGEAVYIGYGSSNSPTLQENNHITVEANRFTRLTAESCDIKAGSQYIKFNYNLIESCGDHVSPPRTGGAANVGFPGAVQVPGHTTPASGWEAHGEIIGNRFKDITSASTKFPDGLIIIGHRGYTVAGNLFSLVDVGSAGLIVFYLDGNVPLDPGDTGTVEVHNNTARDCGSSMNALYRVTNAGTSRPTLLATMNANSNSSNNVRNNCAGAATGADYTVADSAFTDDGTGYPGSYSAPVAGGPLDVTGDDTTAHWSTDYAGQTVAVPVKPGAYQ